MQYQGKQGYGVITNRPGYLFRVARDLVTRDSEAAR